MKAYVGGMIWGTITFVVTVKSMISMFF